MTECVNLKWLLCYTSRLNVLRCCLNELASKTCHYQLLVYMITVVRVVGGLAYFDIIMNTNNNNDGSMMIIINITML